MDWVRILGPPFVEIILNATLRTLEIEYLSPAVILTYMGLHVIHMASAVNEIINGTEEEKTLREKIQELKSEANDIVREYFQTIQLMNLFLDVQWS